MGDFRSLLVPKEGSGRLYLNQYYDLDLGVAMCFEKRVDVKRDRSLSENVLTSEAIEGSRSFFWGRRQWPQASKTEDSRTRIAQR